MTDSARTIRQETEEIEAKVLNKRASHSINSKGRDIPEQECAIRTCYQRDRDRIIHSKAFRRLKHKTQVFFAPKGDHFRTRLTHVLEVSQIGRTIARALRLNEDLVEAISLGHDLGHTPFGHAGESLLNEVNPRGFNHYIQGLRVVEKLEKDGRGLNLTREVRDGILKHSKGRGKIISEHRMPITLEGEVVRISDIIAYINHDLDDALRAGLIKQEMIPSDARDVIGESYSGRIDAMVRDVIKETLKCEYKAVIASEKMLSVIYTLRDFLYSTVYENQAIISEFNKARELLRVLYNYYKANIDLICSDNRGRRGEDNDTIICDFISGMTDQFAIGAYEKIFMPRQWNTA